MALLETMFQVYKRVRFFVTIVFSIGAFCLGVFALGPFLTTQAFSAFSALVTGDQVLSSYFDVQSMLLDDFVASTVPMCVVWSCGLAAYHWQKQNIEIINRVLGYFSLVTGAPGKLLFFLFSTLAGIGTYAMLNDGNQVGLAIILMSGTLFGIPGLLLIACSKPRFQRRVFLDTHAVHGAILFGFLAVAGLVYGILSKYLRFWFAMQTALSAGS